MTKLLFAGLLLGAIRLAAADGPPRHPRIPPKEAIDACASAAKADACSFKHRDHAITGTCQLVPETTTLACRPDHPPPPPPPPGDEPDDRPPPPPAD